MTDPVVLLDQLDKAREAATPGPWRQDGTLINEQFDTVADCWESANDAALIVAAVNALPALTSAVRAVLAAVDAADARVRSSVPSAGAEAVISRGSHTVSVADLRTALSSLAAEPTNPEGTT